MSKDDPNLKAVTRSDRLGNMALDELRSDYLETLEEAAGLLNQISDLKDEHSFQQEAHQKEILRLSSELEDVSKQLQKEHETNTELVKQLMHYIDTDSKLQERAEYLDEMESYRQSELERASDLGWIKLANATF
jgi:hypothetical protein